MNEWCLFWYFSFLVIIFLLFLTCIEHVILYKKIQDSAVVSYVNSLIKQYVFLALFMVSMFCFSICAFFNIDVDYILYPIATLSGFGAVIGVRSVLISCKGKDAK
jgi:hypothetical protein